MSKNKERANKVRRLLGLQERDTPKEYYRVADVLCDLRHYCMINNIDYEKEVEQAEHYYSLEEENK
tara:strand:- start:162 stop:359 length:198 start_codon:yes stop_codon:yes gene_type:complete